MVINYKNQKNAIICRSCRTTYTTRVTHELKDITHEYNKSIFLPAQLDNNIIAIVQVIVVLKAIR